VLRPWTRPCRLLWRGLCFWRFWRFGALQLCFVWRRGQATRGSQLVYLYALASQQRWYAVQLIYVATAAVLIRAP